MARERNTTEKEETSDYIEKHSLIQDRCQQLSVTLVLRGIRDFGENWNWNLSRENEPPMTPALVRQSENVTYMCKMPKKQTSSSLRELRGELQVHSNSNITSLQRVLVRQPVKISAL